jgi:hypothetical protein
MTDDNLIGIDGRQAAQLRKDQAEREAREEILRQKLKCLSRGPSSNGTESRVQASSRTRFGFLRRQLPPRVSGEEIRCAGRSSRAAAHDR